MALDALDSHPAHPPLAYSRSLAMVHNFRQGPSISTQSRYAYLTTHEGDNPTQIVQEEEVPGRLLLNA